MAELLDHWAALASSAVRASRNRLRTVSPSWRASAASRASRSARRATCSFVAALRPATSPSPTRQTDTAAPGPRRPPRPWQYRRPRRSAVRGRCSHARAGARGPITAADQTRIDDALRDARAANTRAQYRSAWRGWAAWCADHGHEAMPADPLAVAAYLAERTERGAADPTAYDGVRRVLQERLQPLQAGRSGGARSRQSGGTAPTGRRYGPEFAAICVTARCRQGERSGQGGSLCGRASDRHRGGRLQVHGAGTG